MNSQVAREIMGALNPTVHFQAGDVNRLPLWPIPDSQRIYDHLDTAFTQHEQARESSIEFRQPGPSPWEWVQAWAQRMVDRAPGEAWEEFAPVYEEPSPAVHVSYGVGVALGRWGGDGSGIQPTPPPEALPHGILFVSSYAEGHPDSLDHPACAQLQAAWSAHGAQLGAPKEDLRSWLQRRFFKEHHRTAFDNRPIFWPLSSAKGSFVAWVSIHRMSRHTLPTLLADHLHPTLQALQGELDDTELRQRAAAGKERAALDKRLTQLHKLREELDAFLQAVDACAHQGPPQPDAKTAPRAVDALYEPVLDDGVMINSAALWPLLDPQWKDPRKWWKELVTAKGRKDYDWSRLAARYFPARVEEKCVTDPSLAVAHGCFWRLHPALAFAWELRLQHELQDPTFTLDERGSDAHRDRFLLDCPDQAAALHAKEDDRRAKAEVPEEAVDDEGAEDGEDGEDD